MLKLKKVDLLGFKSFCERTHITFSGTGITCIVGPNGCGKSNIVDAISWVLGEQSHKSLRAERMADCIFNGTAKRPPMGLSEVSLTLVDPELAEAAAKILDDAEDAPPEAADFSPPQEGAAEANIEGAPESAEAPSFSSETENTPGQGAEKRRRKSQKPSTHLKPGEVVVGRRLYRSGQSEYLLNGRVARLRDIQELFMGMGLGPNSYAIIEQGRIGQILSSRPMDRRAILEEAAGVTKYKTKRRLAEAKLESSKVNLSRVNDILVEVEKQLASLKRQASKARRYAEIREQLRGLQRQVLAGKARELDAEAERLAGLLREVSGQETEQAHSLGELEHEQEKLGARTYELETELRQTQNLLGHCSLELDRAENRIGFNRERIGELETRCAQLLTEAEAAAQEAAGLEARAREHEQSVAALRGQHAGGEQSLAALATRALELTDEQQSLENRIEQLRRTAAELGDQLTQLHAEQAQAEQVLAHHAEARARLAQTEEQLTARAAEQRTASDAAEAACRNAELHARELEQARSEAYTRIGSLRAEQRQNAERCDSLREQLAAARARRTALEQVINDRAYSADAVQKLFATDGEGSAARNGFRAVGLLADYAEVEERYEGAVEQFLREELEYVVVETFDHARAGITLLREEMGGRATFFVDSLRHLKFDEGAAPVPFEREPGVVARMDRLVEFRDPLGAAAKQFLPRLRSAFLVEDVAAAERLASANSQYQFVTPDGTCYHGRTVSGGRPGEAGPLATKRELRVVETQRVQLERAAEEAQAQQAWLGDELERTEQQLNDIIRQILEAERHLAAATHQRDQARAELARTGQQLAECRAELAHLDQQAAAAEQRSRQAQEQRASAHQTRSDAEAEAAQAAERLAALRAELAESQERMAAERAELATAAERLAGAEAVASRLAEGLAEARRREQGLREQQAALSREREELETATAELECRRTTLAEEKSQLEQRRAALEQEFDQTRVRTVEVDDALRLARQRLGDLREQRGQHEIERARNDADRSHLREACLAELNLHPEDLIAQETALITGEELAAAETTQRELKARIESMGAINMMALEEYQECEQRFAFLSRERDDLVQSITDTQQTIAELDQVSRQKFEEAFAAINANFAQAFATLFGGGTGEMRLGEADSSGEPGIDIVAQPPGKRLQNVLLLSGGEKALTALALLIAIFRYQPSPFCILDEVDAPLDEANVGRFARLVSEMSDQTQFLIVTHNRRTMEMAPVLYGVTMQEPGVSKLVSVRWDEPEGEKARTTAA